MYKVISANSAVELADKLTVSMVGPGEVCQVWSTTVHVDVIESHAAMQPISHHHALVFIAPVTRDSSYVKDH